VFVRFADDTINTPTWPDYHLLPDWARKFVNPSVPADGKYYQYSLSDYFNRCSGGDGNGKLGAFKMIGDIYYVTTLQPRSKYKYDGDVELEVIKTLDDSNGVYKVKFKDYDNWKFNKNDLLYNHEYLPGTGDGFADHVFIIWRGNSINWPDYSGLSNGHCYYKTRDSVVVDESSECLVYKMMDKIGPKAANNPAHEYCHSLFGGWGLEEIHWDGRVEFNNGNIGRINSFALECSMNAGYMNAYERYRLGWLDPTIVTSNTNNFVLEDTYIKNKALLIPLRYDSTTGWLKEFYFIENYESPLVSPECNPFMITERFSDSIYNGLLIFHVEDQDFQTPTNSSVNIICADGKWNWNLVRGADTPLDRSDDLIGKSFPVRYGGFDERDYISMKLGGRLIYGDYVCLQPRSDFPGAHYGKNTWLGKYDDFFRLGYNEVFTKYSNPAAYAFDGTLKDIGLQILSYDPVSREYVLSLQFDEQGISALNPSKPQNLRAVMNSGNQYELTWEPWLEPAMKGGQYKIFRASDQILPLSYKLIAAINSASGDNIPVTSWTDPVTITPGNGNNHLYYKISAVDINGKESVQSDTIAVAISQVAFVNNSGNPAVTSYELMQNYPNPFNPSTMIKYQLPKSGFVNLKVYDILGREVATLINENKIAGFFEVNFDASKLSDGIYIYQLKANDFVSSKKMILLK
jgi:hypothetical protein